MPMLNAMCTDPGQSDLPALAHDSFADRSRSFGSLSVTIPRRLLLHSPMRAPLDPVHDRVPTICVRGALPVLPTTP